MHHELWANLMVGSAIKFRDSRYTYTSIFSLNHKFIITFSILDGQTSDTSRSYEVPYGFQPIGYDVICKQTVKCVSSHSSLNGNSKSVDPCGYV